MRAAAFIGAALLLATALPSVARAADTKTLDIGLRRQHTPVWCWGATIAMAVEYLKNFDVQDCEVLAEYDMRFGGRGLCCLNALECLRTGGLGEMGGILGSIFAIHGRSAGPLAFSDVVEQIDDGRPLIAGLRKPGGGHVVVIAGYRKPDQVLVLDPIHGKVWAAYGTLVANWQYGIWTDSLVFSTDRGDGECKRVLQGIPTPLGPVTRPRVVCR
jgi:Papain-like cysteine protease AvrRpt2